jgi:hypothetical protein
MNVKKSVVGYETLEEITVMLVSLPDIKEDQKRFLLATN